MFQNLTETCRRTLVGSQHGAKDGTNNKVGWGQKWDQSQCCRGPKMRPTTMLVGAKSRNHTTLVRVPRIEPKQLRLAPKMGPKQLWWVRKQGHQSSIIAYFSKCIYTILDTK